jgi:hypothetical protein
MGKQDNQQNSRRMSDRQFKKTESQFRQDLANNQKLDNDAAQIREIIKNKYIESPSASGKAPAIKTILTSAQVTAFRLESTQIRASKKIAKRDLKISTKKYVDACKRMGFSAKLKIKRFNEKSRLAVRAGRESENLTQTVFSFITQLEANSDPRISELKILALRDGLNFSNTLFRILKIDLKDADALNLLSSNPSIRSGIFRKVRESFGWIYK